MHDENTILLQMQQKQLEILHEFDRVCKKNNLKYALSSRDMSRRS